MCVKSFWFYFQFKICFGSKSDRTRRTYFCESSGMRFTKSISVGLYINRADFSCVFIVILPFIVGNFECWSKFTWCNSSKGNIRSTGRGRIQTFWINTECIISSLCNHIGRQFYTIGSRRFTNRRKRELFRWNRIVICISEFEFIGIFLISIGIDTSRIRRNMTESGFCGVGDIWMNFEFGSFRGFITSVIRNCNSDFVISGFGSVESAS